MTIKAPWLNHYADVPHHLEYPEGNMFSLLDETVQKYPNYTAYSFLGNHTTFKSFAEQVQVVAKAFYAAGIREGQRVTLCLPNLPQTILCFYALNIIGAVSNMIHPLSSEGEIVFFLKDSESVAAVTLDQFYGKFAAARKEYDLPTLVIVSIGDALAPLKRLGYKLTEGRKVFHEELCRIGTLLNERAQGQRQLHSSEDARMFNTMFLNLVHPRRGVFCFSQPKACLSANPAEEVEKLFDCYVSRNKEHFFVMPQENENGILDFASSVQ